MSVAPEDTRRRLFGGHPRGALTLLGVMALERFAYYGARGLLILFLVQQLLMSQDEVSAFFGAFLALAYFTPILGAVIAERWLGLRRALIAGLGLMAAGFLCLAAPLEPPQRQLEILNEVFFDQIGPETHVLTPHGSSEVQNFIRNGQRCEIAFLENDELLIGCQRAALNSPIGTARTSSVQVDADGYAFSQTGGGLLRFAMTLGVALIALSAGLFKAPALALLGRLYDRNPELRDSGFALSEGAVNLGALLSSLTIGAVALGLGWSYAFALCALIALAAGGWLIWVSRYGRQAAAFVEDELPNLSRRGLIGLIAAGIVLLVYAVWRLEAGSTPLGPWESAGLVMLSGGYIAWRLRSLDFTHARRAGYALALVVATAFFWSLLIVANPAAYLLQAEIAAGICSLDGIDPQWIAPVGVILLAPALALVWTWFARTGRDLSTFMKFAFGFLAAAAGFYIFAFGITPGGGPIAISVLLVSLALLALAQLLIAPTGVAAMTRLAANGLASSLIAAWFLASHFASLVDELLGASSIFTPSSGGLMADLVRPDDVFQAAGRAAILAAIAA
jgi:POT family proton-dependent oligopeptide transporter